MKVEEIEGYEMHDLLSINLPRHFDIAGSILISIFMLQLSSSFFFKEIWARKY
jgi:hypothetical protein